MGDGPVRVVLVHGMFNASSYWGAAYDHLTHTPTPGRLLAVDLAGFGESLGVENGYGPDDQADAVAATLRAAGADRPVVVGAHSIGTVVAVALAARHPQLVSGIVAFSPPWYEDQRSARSHLASTDPLARLLLSDARLARRACEQMCRHRRAAGLLIRLARPGLPHQLAADRVRHTWTSYAESLHQLVLAGQAPAQLDHLRVPVHLLVGDRDEAIDTAFLHRLAGRHPHVTVSTLSSAGHDLPLSHPERCRTAIEALAR